MTKDMNSIILCSTECPEYKHARAKDGVIWVQSRRDRGTRPPRRQDLLTTSVDCRQNNFICDLLRSVQIYGHEDSHLVSAIPVTHTTCDLATNAQIDNDVSGDSFSTGRHALRNPSTEFGILHTCFSDATDLTQCPPPRAFETEPSKASLQPGSFRTSTYSAECRLTDPLQWILFGQDRSNNSCMRC